MGFLVLTATQATNLSIVVFNTTSCQGAYAYELDPILLYEFGYQRWI